MGRLVDDLLLLARLDQGRPLEQAPVRLEVLVEDAVRDARAVDPQREITASIEHRATVLGDDGRLRQVVGNLVRNALVHTPEGTPVHVRVDRTTDTAILEVHDDGPGMSDEVAAQAFERFYRADPSRVAQPRRQRARPRDRRGDRARARRHRRARHRAGPRHDRAHRAPRRARTATRPRRHDAVPLSAYIARTRPRPRWAMAGRGGNRACISARVATRRRARRRGRVHVRVRARRPRVPRVRRVGRSRQRHGRFGACPGLPPRLPDGVDRRRELGGHRERRVQAGVHGRYQHRSV